MHLAVDAVAAECELLAALPIHLLLYSPFAIDHLHPKCLVRIALIRFSRSCGSRGRFATGVSTSATSGSARATTRAAVCSSSVASDSNPG